MQYLKIRLKRQVRFTCASVRDRSGIEGCISGAHPRDTAPRSDIEGCISGAHPRDTAPNPITAQQIL